LVKSTLVMATVLFVLRSINRFVTRYPNRIVNQAIAVLTLLVAGGGGVFLLVMTYLNLYVGYLNLNS
jgi:hypothetical protein